MKSKAGKFKAIVLWPPGLKWKLNNAAALLDALVLGSEYIVQLWASTGSISQRRLNLGCWHLNLSSDTGPKWLRIAWSFTFLSCIWKLNAALYWEQSRPAICITWRGKPCQPESNWHTNPKNAWMCYFERLRTSFVNWFPFCIGSTEWKSLLKCQKTT